MNLTNDQRDALDTLKSIAFQLDEMGTETKHLIRTHFPHDWGQANAYKIFEFGTSCNPYDTTLETIINNIEREAREQMK